MCPREFDGWTCINATPAGSVAQFPCPFFVIGFDPNRKSKETFDHVFLTHNGLNNFIGSNIFILLFRPLQAGRSAMSRT